MATPLGGLRSLVASVRGLLQLDPFPLQQRQHRRLKSRCRLQFERLEGRELLSVTSPVNTLAAPLVVQQSALNSVGGVLSMASGNRVYFSPDNIRLTGGGNTQLAYDGAAGAVTLTPTLTGGVLAQFESDNSVFLSPDYLNLHGGGATIQVYDGSLGAVKVFAVGGGGVLTQVVSNNQIFYSPDQFHLTGGGNTTQVYDGSLGPVKLLNMRNGGVLVQVLATNQIFKSTDNKNLTTITTLTKVTNTTMVYDGTGGPLRLVGTYTEGIYAISQRSGAIYYSTDFNNLGGGGTTKKIYDGSGARLNLVALREGGVLIQNTATKQIYFSTDYTRLPHTGSTDRVYDGSRGALSLIAVQGGGVLATVAQTNQVFFSADGKGLLASSHLVYSGKLGRVKLTALKTGGVLTEILKTGAVFYSPDYKNLVGGGNSGRVYNGTGSDLAFTSVLPGLKLQDVKIGSGTTATLGSKLSVLYKGMFENGTVFDTNMDANGNLAAGKQLLSYTIGNGDVIKGFDEGSIGMLAGGERIVKIPSPLGYGTRGQGNIPPNTPLIFDIKVQSIT